MRVILSLALSVLTFTSLLSQSSPKIDLNEKLISELLLSRNDSALGLALTWIDESTTNDDKLGLAKGNLYTGLHFLNFVRFDSAFKYLSQSERLYKKHQIYGDSISSGYVKLAEGLGRYYINKRKFELGEAYIKQALSLYRKVGEKNRIVSALNLLGGSKGRQGDYTGALSFFLEAYPDAQYRSKSTILGNIALCYKSLGQYDQSIKYLKEGLKIDYDSGWSVQVNKLNSLGTIYSTLNESDSSAYYSKKALEAAKKFNNPRSAALALSNLATRAVLDDQYKLGEKYMNEALRLADSSGISIKENFFHIKTGISYQKKNYDSLIYYGRKAVKSSEENSNKLFLSSIAEKLSEGYAAIGKMDSSLYYYKLFHNREKEMFNFENQRKFTQLYAQMENAEQLNEIELLEKQKEIDFKNQVILIGLLISIIIISASIVIAIAYRQKNRSKKQKIKELELKASIEKKELQLQQQALHMINMNNNISEVESSLKEIKKKNELTVRDVQRVLSNITVSKSMDEEWRQFEGYFTSIHPNFSAELLKKHEKLTQQERRLTALIKMDLSNREIAGILRIAQRSVIMKRFRLKKSFGLTEEEDLEAYIQQF